MSPIVWLTSLILVCVASSKARDFEAEVDDLVNSGITARGIPGVSLAVVYNGNVVLTKGYGVKDLDTKVPADADTLFGIASLTKAFTVSVLANVMRKNSTFNLSTKISDILGHRWTKFNNTQLSTYATVQDLMTHAMGVPRNNFIRLDNELTRANIMERMTYLEATKVFRRSFVYSDMMYGLLTHIIEKISGKLWEDVVISELYQPLSMDNSTFMTRVNFSDPSVATPYTYGDNGSLAKADPALLSQYAGIGGSGAVMSTARNMASYLQFLTNGGKNQKGVQVVQADDLKEFYTPLAVLTSSPYKISKPTMPVTMSTDAYGLAWRLGYYRGYKMIQHTGSTFGYNSMITILPSFSTAVFTALSGSDSGYNFRGALHCAILDSLLGETPWINSTTIATFPAPWIKATRRKRNVNRDRTENTVDEENPQTRNIPFSEHQQTRRSASSSQDIPFQNYTGLFVHGGYGKVNLFLDPVLGKLKMKYGIGEWELSNTGSGNVFDADWLGSAPSFDVQLRFLVDENVYGFECLDCDNGYVPAFYRHENRPENNNRKSRYA